MKSIKYIICCFVALSLPATAAFAQEAPNLQSAQEYLANSIKIEAGQPSKDQIQDLYDEMDLQLGAKHPVCLARINGIPFRKILKQKPALEQRFIPDIAIIESISESISVYKRP